MADDKPTQIGKYEVLSVLGRGGMGIVYQARDPEIDRIVAIKTISISRELGPLATELSAEDLLQRLRMEARSAGRLHHPNIVTVFDFGSDEDNSYIVMEYAEGIDLSEIIQGAYPLLVSDKLDILMQICSGLAYAHELGVVHRDMKPANVRLTSRRIAKILDFGLARFDTTKLTKTGFLSGTIAYMSPERIGGQSGPSDDIFALGGIAYELLTYKRAYPGLSPPEIIYKIMSVDPPAVSSVIDLPAELDPIIQRSLAKDPHERYQTADEFAAGLRDFRNSEVLRDFLSDANRRADIEKASEFFKDPKKFGVTRNESSIRKVFSDSGERNTSAYIPTALHSPTAVRMHPRRPSKISPLIQSDRPYSTAETRIDSHPAAPATLISGDAGTRVGETPIRARRPWWIAIAAVAVLAVAGFLFFRPDEQTIKPGPAVTTTQADQKKPAEQTALAPVMSATQTTSSTESLASWETERELVRRLRADASAARLSRGQKTRFQQAEAAADLAERKFADRDVEAGGQLLTGAISDLEKLLEEVRTRSSVAAAKPAQTAARKNRDRTQTPNRPGPSTQPAQTVQVPEPKRTPVETREVPVAASYPPPIERPQPPPPRVDYDALRREVSSFMKELARAYQDKNVAFFRENHQKFSEQMATAVRSSPSIRVEYQVESVEFDGPSRATVVARRTDTFSARGMDPAVQRLTYHLTRTGDGWKIVDSQRQK